MKQEKTWEKKWKISSAKTELMRKQLSSAEVWRVESVSTLWLKRPTLQITSAPHTPLTPPPPPRLSFSCQQSFCWSRRPIFKRWISVWSGWNGAFQAVCGDYTWKSKRLSRYLITADPPPSIKHLADRVKTPRKKPSPSGKDAVLFNRK